MQEQHSSNKQKEDRKEQKVEEAKPQKIVQQQKVFPQPFDMQKLSQIRQSVIDDSEVLKMRIPCDQIICDRQDSDYLIHSITCPICLMILQPPYYECQGCSNGFCTLCLESWWKKSPKTCAYKCTNVQFKQVKRSNTYNALISMLKLKCQFCRQQKTIADISTHILKICPKLPQICRFCQAKIERKDMENHQKQICLERPWNCQFCTIQYPYKQKQTHSQCCTQKKISCSYEGCNQLVKKKDFEKHIQLCDYRKIICQWCEQEMNQKSYATHKQICDKHIIQCNWCLNSFNISEIKNHENTCPLRKQSCRLCLSMVRVNQIDQHKLACMFENLVQIKYKSDVLEKENIRLKQKVMMLQGLLQQTIANRQSNAMKAIVQMRQQQKRVIQKDLLRINNSIKSVQKLRNQQTNAHMKMPHLIQSWCPFCKELDKRFKGMLQPLLEQKKQVLHKLSEIQRYSVTPK